MSKANGAIENKDTYLQHVSLKNYKSIKDAEIDFKPGLNIIIGKNASGKTNFINGLNFTLNFAYDQHLDTESTIETFFKSDKLAIQVLRKDQNGEYLSINGHKNLQNYHQILLKINGTLIPIEDQRFVSYRLSEQNLFIDNSIIKYGFYYKETALFINLPFSFTVVRDGKISSELLKAQTYDNNTRFLDTFFFRLYGDIYRFYNNEPIYNVLDKDFKDRIIGFSEQILRDINDTISYYTPVRAVRLNPNFNIITDMDEKKRTINNFQLEFLIDKNWLTFSLLSDGSKRLFYIISEMLDTNAKNGSNNALNIILLEEPELGIHPHQLHQLMQFIKEQSLEKQIILTTHSPQVLDVLEPDELDRVIICHYDSKKGTQLSHLSEKQMAKARKYMKEEAFLSDYWRFSDLEPAN